MIRWLLRITISASTSRAKTSLAFGELHSTRFLYPNLLLALVALSACGGCRQKPPHDQQNTRNQTVQLDHVVLNGNTMGTTYSIRYQPSERVADEQVIHQLIEAELETVNAQMSTYREDSEVSRFNRWESSVWFSVSSETANVVQLAQTIAGLSDGAFDVTVGPVVDQWGFGTGVRREGIPTDGEIEAARELVGYKNLEVRISPPGLRKLIPKLRIDLSAIAKGHGADRVSDLLERHGIQDSFVEIGGEIVTRGHRNATEPWQIGIESPQDFKRSIGLVIELSDSALATSGDYRNFFTHSDTRFSHTINPITGRPVTHSTASCSVVASNAAQADAIATCMMVLGSKDGLRLADENDWAVLLVDRTDGGLVPTYSKPLEKVIPDIDRKVQSLSSRIPTSTQH
jgi:FAD:protein FMN transferase